MVEAGQSSLPNLRPHDKIHQKANLGFGRVPGTIPEAVWWKFAVLDDDGKILRRPKSSPRQLISQKKSTKASTLSPVLLLWSSLVISSAKCFMVQEEWKIVGLVTLDTKFMPENDKFKSE